MSRIIDLPGEQKATLATELSEWTPRRRRPMELVGARLGGVMPLLQKAGRILCDGDVIEDRTGQVDDQGERVFPGPDVDLTERQLALTSRFNDAIAWGMLLDWTLDQPVPDSPDDMLDDCPADVYDALRIAAARQAIADGGFDVDTGVENPESPTGP